MPFCPKCGNDVGNNMFCPECGAKQGVRDDPYDTKPSRSPEYDKQQPREGFVSPPFYQPARRSGGITYDETICLILCCCVTPIGAILYYLLTDHPENY